ncbi:MAG: hypothetical protein DSY53_01755 [Persephonella sp.]|nr:MAG: hypothetical protein DSY53_01755 [Persephonella sp.]
MKKVLLAVFLSISTTSIVFADNSKIEKSTVKQNFKVKSIITEKDLKNFEMEADYQLLKLSAEIESDFKKIYSEN